MEPTAAILHFHVVTLDPQTEALSLQAAREEKLTFYFALDKGLQKRKFVPGGQRQKVEIIVEQEA